MVGIRSNGTLLPSRALLDTWAWTHLVVQGTCQWRSSSVVYELFKPSLVQLRILFDIGRVDMLDHLLCSVVGF